METDEEGKAISVAFYGKKSRYYIDPTVKTKECQILVPADPKKIEAYRKANPHLYTEKAIKERERIEKNRARYYKRTYGV